MLDDCVKSFYEIHLIKEYRLILLFRCVNSMSLFTDSKSYLF